MHTRTADANASSESPKPAFECQTSTCIKRNMLIYKVFLV